MTKLSHVLKMRPAGIEPTHPAWQAGRLPLHHGRSARIGSAKWAGRRSNPRMRFFKPPLYHLSYQPKFVLGTVSLIERSQQKARRRYDTGPCGSSKSRPGVINAHYRWRAHIWAVHSPVGQMIYQPANMPPEIEL